MTLWHFLLIYFSGFLLITIAVGWSLRDEPTAHGQIVGSQVGCLVALFWPIAAPLILLASFSAGVARVFGKD